MSRWAHRRADSPSGNPRDGFLLSKSGESVPVSYTASVISGDDVQSELEGEFADVMAWMTTLANITGIDLDAAVHRKYIEDGGPEGTK